MTNELNSEQMQAIEEMIARRMTNTGESREEACDQLSEIFEGLIIHRSN